MKIIDNQFLDLLSQKAKESDRLRMNYNLHTSATDPIQRLLNALEPDTYICPHKHENPDKRELFIPVIGSFSLVTFDDRGEIQSVVTLSNYSPQRIAEIESGVWHTIICNEPSTVYFEIKDGPYNVNNDKNFAPWAPAEFSDETISYLTQLRLRISMFIKI